MLSICRRVFETVPLFLLVDRAEPVVLELSPVAGEWSPRYPLMANLIDFFLSLPYLRTASISDETGDRYSTITLTADYGKGTASNSIC